MRYHVKVTSASLPYLPDIGVTEPMEEIIELDDALEADALLRAVENTIDDDGYEYAERDAIDIDISSNDIIA